jgi:hypothetical protein
MWGQTPALYHNIVEGLVCESHKVVIGCVIRTAAYVLECNHPNCSRSITIFALPSAKTILRVSDSESSQNMTVLKKMRKWPKNKVLKGGRVILEGDPA